MRPFPQTLDVISCECLVRSDPSDELARGMLSDALYEADYGAFTSCQWAAKQTAERECRRRDRDRVIAALYGDSLDRWDWQGRIRSRTPGEDKDALSFDVLLGNQPPTIIGRAEHYRDTEGQRYLPGLAMVMAVLPLELVGSDRRIAVGAGWVIRWILDPEPVLIV